MKDKKGLPKTAYELKEGETYIPYVQGDNIAEFTVKSVISGILLGIIFGAANTYLGLMAGLTISTSIPVAVLTVVVFRALSAMGQKHTILEANMSQTIGSASSSLASGVLFTIPALFIWGMNPPLLQLTLLAVSGGLIGVLAMIPLRKYLIKKEHGKLPYPEGLACAEVLVASEGGGKQAINVFLGLGVGAFFKFLTHVLKIISYKFNFYIGKATIAAKVSPALMGVGYILGPRIATVMVSGAALSSFVIIPLIAWWGNSLDAPFYPETELLIREMSPSQIWNRYVRYIGAGAVATAGIITLIKSLPVMVESFKLGIAQMSKKRSEAKIERTDTDLSFKFVFGAATCILLVLVFVPGILGFLDSIAIKAVAALLIAVFAFFFVTVSSRIVGMVGVTSNPTSGMTIASLLGTSFVFYLMGWTDLAGKATALMVGTTVCIAASIAGDTSQDLKTGYLLGATPRRQQIGELMGVITAAFFVCWTMIILHKTIGVGTEELPAPQGVLMGLVINGVIEANLPWTLIFIGVGLTLGATFFRVPLLAFAVGVYLPLATMAPVFFGGLLRHLITRKKTEHEAGNLREKGVLFASGLVGGEGLMGVGIALIVLASDGMKIKGFPLGLPGWGNSLVSLAGIAAILWLISKAAKGKLFK
ncbi:OPT family oligopeptide transporter [Elusimicrobiota bacterium]